MDEENVITIMQIIGLIIMLLWAILWMNLDNKYDNELALRYCGLAKYSGLNSPDFSGMSCYKLDNHPDRTFVFCDYSVTFIGKPKEETTKCYERLEQDKYIGEGFTYAKEFE